MKNITESIQQNITEASDAEKQFNVFRRLGTYEGLLLDLLRSKKISADDLSIIKDEIKKYPIPKHLENERLNKLLK